MDFYKTVITDHRRHEPQLIWVSGANPHTPRKTRAGSVHVIDSSSGQFCCHRCTQCREMGGGQIHIYFDFVKR